MNQQKTIDALAEQNRQMRDALEFLNSRVVTMDLGGVVERALNLPDLSTSILNQLDARTLREAANGLPYDDMYPLFLAPPTAPEGYILVPKVPTEAMYQAGNNTPCTADDDDWREDYKAVWQAMIAAGEKK